MKRQLCLLLICFSLIILSTAFTKEDHEIFRLREEVHNSEGFDVTFYDFLGVEPSATIEDIGKAFRKKSRALHPDKVKHNFVASKSTPNPKKPGEKRKPGVHVSKGPSQKEIQKFVKQAAERYSRLTVVANILRGPQKERYDHFLRHGFPAWKGTGYYYSRYRPGLGTVLFGLFLVGGGGAHYLALTTSYKRQKEFMGKYIRNARKSAWGDESGIRGIPGISGPVAVEAPPPAPTEPDPMANLNRKQKREMERQNKKDKSKGRNGKSSGTSTPQPVAPVTSANGEKRRVTAENGKILVVDSAGNVFLEEEDEEGNVELFLLDPSEIHKPTLRDTAVFRLPIWLFRKAFDPFLKHTQPVPSDEVPQTESEKEGQQQATSAVPQIIVNPVDTNSSQEQDSGFEIVDSTGIDKEMANAEASNAKKRNKKSKK